MAWTFLSIIVVLANVVEATTGFGSTILAVTFGSMLMPIEELVPLLVPLNIVLSTIITLRHPRGIDTGALWRQILPVAGAGLFLGLAVFHLSHGRTLKLLFGLFVMGLALFELWRRRRAGELEALGPRAASIWLFVGGQVHGLYASGGPMLVYFASRNLADKHQFRSTLSALWLVLSLAMAANHIMSGLLDDVVMRESMLLLPAVAVGVVAGEWLHIRVNERRFRLITLVLLVAAGLAVVLNP